MKTKRKEIGRDQDLKSGPFAFWTPVLFTDLTSLQKIRVFLVCLVF